MSARARGEGSLYRRPRSRFWWAAWLDKDGVRRLASTGHAAKGRASEWLLLKLDEVRAGIPEHPEETTLSTLRRLVSDDYQANGRKS